MKSYKHYKSPYLVIELKTLAVQQSKDRLMHFEFGPSFRSKIVLWAYPRETSV